MGDGGLDAGDVVFPDQLDEALGLAEKLGLGDELAVVDAARQGAQQGHVACRGGAIVFLGLAARFPADARAAGGQDFLDVLSLDDRVEVDVVGVQEARVFYGRQDGGLDGLREKRVLVRRLVAADCRVDPFVLEEKPVHQAQLRARDFHAARLIDRLVKRELNALNQVEDDGIL